jgi:thiol:disulfide interchange protein
MKIKLLFTVFLLLGAAFILKASEPFVWQTKEEKDKLLLTCTVKKNHYLYVDSLVFVANSSDNSIAKAISGPSGVPYKDEFQGVVKIIKEGTYTWVWQGKSPFKLQITFQGCSVATKDSEGMCFMPQTVTLLPKKTTPLEKIETSLKESKSFLDNIDVVKKAQGYMDTKEFISFLSNNSNIIAKDISNTQHAFSNVQDLMLIVVILLGGLGLNFTPCILPMIPINIAIIGANSSKKTGFIRGLLYGCGIATAYGVLGVCAVTLGMKFGQLNSSYIFNFIIGAIFIILAISMAGFINIDLSKYRFVNANNLKSLNLLLPFILGGISALLAGACVAPVAISVLLLSIERYNAGSITALLWPFLLGVGMALPWPIIGSGLAKLPRPGKFMVYVKYTFALLITIMAIYYIYVGITLLPGSYNPKAEIAKLEAATIESAKEKKLLLIDFTASWCKNCHAMDKNIFPNKDVQAALKDYKVVKFKAEDLNSPALKEILNRFDIKGLPSFVVLDWRRK